MTKVMTRQRLHHLLTSALFTALSACGGVVTETGGSDAATDTGTGSDTAADSPPDLGLACRPIADSTTCGEKVTYPCGLPFEPAGPTPTADECKSLCAPITFSGGSTGPMFCNVWSPEDTGPAKTVSCASCAIGRRPADLLEGDASSSQCNDPVGVALAEMARIEAASVHAFRRLEHSLGALHADDELLARVRHAARDEIAHARLVGGLARERGVAPRPVKLDRAHTSTTFELALENAVEGCVHETLGVAYLDHQRLHAEDPALRAMAEALYEDELDHAALSWDLVAFFDAHLDARQRAELRKARARALDDVIAEAGRIDPTVVAALGLPSRAVVAEMVGSLRETLFA